VAQANRFTAIILCVVAGALLSAAPARAQYSPGFKFLEAVKKKDGDAVVLALKSPGSTIINSRDITTGKTALHIVTQRRDVLWMQFLLAQGANPNVADTKGVTPLVLATQLGFLEGAETLIAKGAKVDIPNATGETPLIGAVHRHDIPMLRLLLKSGADPDRADNSGRSARDYAKLEGASGNLVSEIAKNEKSASQREGAKTYGPSY
jgi:ankyrin repeat protein